MWKPVLRFKSLKLYSTQTHHIPDRPLTEFEAQSVFFLCKYTIAQDPHKKDLISLID